MKDKKMLNIEQQERLQQAEQQVLQHKKGNPPKFKNTIDRISRQERRNPYRTKYRNDRVPVGSGVFMIGKWFNSWSAIFTPKRTKFKGWMRKAS
jgi:hypothetical protein